MNIATVLTAFVNKENVTNFGSPKSQIRKEGEKLVRVWNDGMGLITFAQIAEDNTLLINECFINSKERNLIISELKVDYKFISLGYPAYYSESLISLYNKCNKD